MNGIELPVAGYRILFADYNNVNQRLATNILGKLNNLCIVGDGKQALEQAQSGKFDIIFLQVSLPVMGGYEAAGKIREWEAEHNARRTPILGMTPSRFTQSRDDCIRHGMDDVYVKPIRKKTLLEAVHQHAARHPDGHPGMLAANNESA
ncbi:histidine kinase osmosensor [Emmonsiellopsis sp. PD_33]|nr:histidine kinase osmosensor [Emmonsiellopsis sp. PD_33]